MRQIHYGWKIIFMAAAGIFGCLGLGRFALGMLLPSMSLALELNYQQMGTISTANFCGYLTGILCCTPLVKRFGIRHLAAAGLLLTGVSMVGVALCSELYAITALYFITGAGGALANIPIMALVAAWFTPTMRGKAAGYMVTGNAIAIIFSGQLIPRLHTHAVDNWRIHWIVLGAVVLLIAWLFFRIVRNSPTDCRLAPLGEPSRESAVMHGEEENISPVPPLLTLHCGLLYGLFGFTFISYVTFIVTTMVEQYGFTQQTAGNFWSWVGLLGLFSGPVAGWFSDRFPRKYILAAIFTIQTFAFLLVGLDLSSIALYGSIAFFGIVAWSIPSTMAALCSDYAGPGHAVAMFSSITLIFAVGQIAGPLLTGILAQHSGDFRLGYLVAAALTASAVAFSLLLPTSNSV